MTVKPLLPQQPVTAKGDAPSRDLIEIIQRLVRELETQGAALAALQAKVAAAAAVANAAGGATIDVQARAQLAAIRAALT
jgi:chemotaxis receptor (MCP) glutamine deamidase CheD